MHDMTAAFRDVLHRLKLKYTEKGNRLEMLCPFHDDRTPSSGVYKDTAKFYCFSCDLTLNAAQFLAKMTGEGEDKATKQLEEKYGPIGQEKDKDKALRVVKERARVERLLRLFREEGASRIDFGLVSELVDRAFFLFEVGILGEDTFDTCLSLWYNDVEAIIGAVHAERHVESGGAADPDAAGGVPQGTSNLLGDGAQALRRALEPLFPESANRLRQVAPSGSDLIELA